MPTDADMMKLIEAELAAAKPRHVLRTMFNMADSFAQSAQMSLHKIHQTKNADFAAPALMCQSFAIELLLKLFIVATDESIATNQDLEQSDLKLRGHTYSDLFGRLARDEKRVIAKHYEKITGEQTSDHRFNELLKSTGDSPFVEWRYAHEIIEPKHLDIALLNNLCNALGLAAQDVIRART